jgi:hypothetical protein
MSDVWWDLSKSEFLSFLLWRQIHSYCLIFTCLFYFNMVGELCNILLELGYSSTFILGSGFYLGELSWLWEARTPHIPRMSCFFVLSLPKFLEQFFIVFPFLVVKIIANSLRNDTCISISVFYLSEQAHSQVIAIIYWFWIESAVKD